MRRICSDSAEVIILTFCSQKQVIVTLLLCAAVNSVQFSALATTPPNDANNKLVLRFCYEDKQLLPYYAGNSAEIPVTPGATIEHLQQVSGSLGITLELIRMPWLRCLQQLAGNNVDALVAAYSEERAHYTYFPKDQYERPDPARAINTNALCLAHRFDNDLAQKITNESAPLTISRPYGYRPLPLPAHAVLVGAYSLGQALELVVSGRVDATTVTCEINGLPGNKQEIDTLPLKILHPPVYHSVGYLMLSEQFFQQNPAISEKIWQALPQNLDHRRYLEYLAYPIGF